MPEFRYLPISRLDEAELVPLLHEEESAWMSDLNWDYAPIREILIALARRKHLPGFAATLDGRALGYTYFLVNQAKGIIGAIYAARGDGSQKAVDTLLSMAIASLQDSPTIGRIEAQIMPFNDFELPAIFVQHGFSHYPRYFLVRDLGEDHKAGEHTVDLKILPWASTHLVRAAEMSVLSYREQPDAEICEDYRTKAGCESYLRSLVENPGCGIFEPESSFVAVNREGFPCGFVLASRISNEAAIIPQIAVHPAYQAMGVGNILMNRTLERLKAKGYRSVSLTVTHKNRRAYEWYRRLGFRTRKEFGAYVWQRPD